jgi:hypothetical protein
MTQRHVSGGLLVLAIVFPLAAQSPPLADVIVSDLGGVQLWGTANGHSVYSIGTTCCSVGTSPLTWNAASSLHGVIGQNMYRLLNGRFEQIGMSWLRHGANPAPGGACGTCPPGGTNVLNPGCSTIATASANGTQSALGPMNEVNAATGAFPFPVAGSYPAPSALDARRLQVATADLDPTLNAGAKYFLEAQCIHPEDAAAGNGHDNASYRQVTVGANNQLAFAGATQQMKPAIQAWKDSDPQVQIAIVDVPGDGRLLVGFKAVPIVWPTYVAPYFPPANYNMPVPNTPYRYEYAVQNLSSDRGVGALSVELWPGADATNVGFHAPAHHSGEPYSNAAWTTAVVQNGLFPGSLTWSTTPHATDPNANALRFGGLSNFWFECNELPGTVKLTLFKPGATTEITLPLFAPPKRPYGGYDVTLSSSGIADSLDISTTGLPGPVGDDNSFAVPLGFSFPFYGQLHNQVVVSTNGYLTFPGDNGNLSANTALPNPAFTTGLIAGYWDDLDCSNTFDIRWKQVTHFAPNKPVSGGLWLVVDWNCRHAGDTQALHFQVILKPDGTIVSTILQCPGLPYSGATATRGVQSPAGGLVQPFSHDAAFSALPGQAVRYMPSVTTSSVYVQGRTAGGMLRVTYVGASNAPLLTMVSSMIQGITSGPFGPLPNNPLLCTGVSDYLGLMTGVADPTAITDAAGVQDVTTWVPPGTLPTGLKMWFWGVDFPASPTAPSVPNGLFNVSNLAEIPHW